VSHLYRLGKGEDHGVSVVLRPAGPADGPFLAQMLVVAACWRSEEPLSGSVDEVLDRPELARYVAGWPQRGDIGVIAEDQRPIGAAWLRFLSETEPGYGFVDAHTPELSMGVVPRWRGQGVGADLLGALVIAASNAGLSALSLSVERENDAFRLYERFGFHTVATVGESLTMLLAL